MVIMENLENQASTESNDSTTEPDYQAIEPNHPKPSRQAFAELLKTLEDEEVRRPIMIKDANEKASKIHEEIIFHHGGHYDKLIGAIATVFANQPRHPRDSLGHICLQYSGQVAICQAFQDLIFDTIGLDQAKRPSLNLIEKNHFDRTSINTKRQEQDIDLTPGRLRHSEQIRAEGTYRDNPQAEANGVIEIYLYNFNENPDIRDILRVLEHECFHAYQFSLIRKNLQLKTKWDEVRAAAYCYGAKQLKHASEIGWKTYNEQGFERSAKEFTDNLTRATEVALQDGLKSVKKSKDTEDASPIVPLTV